MFRIFICFLLIVLYSCNRQESYTYIGGGIIHPKDDVIVLSNPEKIIDTIRLDHKGHFHFKFQLDKEGLFTFRHADEFQMVYLKPQDSLRLRLNTSEFDESLVFSGKGSVENNFLIENFLLNQKNSDLILSYYKISPKDFQFKTDSIKQSREKHLYHLKGKHNLSEPFINLAQKSIDYEYYDMRERYAFLLNKYDPKKASTINENFYDYRQNIDFNDTVARNLIVYRRFLDDYIKNQSIKICLDKNKKGNCYDVDSYTNLDDRIHLVDSLIKDRKLRKTYFERFIQEEIIYAQNPDDLEHTKKFINKFDFTEKEKKRLESLVEFQGALIVDADLKDVTIKCKDFKKHKLKDVMKKNHAIIYSWTLQSPSHHKLRLKTIKELKDKYTDIQFIGINIDYNYPDEWLTAVNNHNENIENEFTIVPQKHSDFYRNYLNKIFFVNKDCIIKKSEIVLSNQDLEGYVKEYLALVKSFDK
jgi:hypothetical protein